MSVGTETSTEQSIPLSRGSTAGLTKGRTVGLTSVLKRGWGGSVGVYTNANIEGTEYFFPLLNAVFQKQFSVLVVL